MDESELDESRVGRKQGWTKTGWTKTGWTKMNWTKSGSTDWWRASTYYALIGGDHGAIWQDERSARAI